MAYEVLREEHYYKTGRKGVVFEAVDALKPNLFDDNNNISSAVFHKFSKIRFTVVNAKTKDPKTGKGVAVTYSLDPSEILLLTYILSDCSVSGFEQRAGAYSNLKGTEQIALKEIISGFSEIDIRRFDRVLPIDSNTKNNKISFTKNIGVGGNNLKVRKFTISYESGMNSASKWKVTIEEGYGLKKAGSENGLNILDQSTYKTHISASINLQREEILIPVNEGAKRVVISQIAFYSQMLKARSLFGEAKRKNEDYNGERINEWNAKGKPVEFKKVDVPEIKSSTQKPSSSTATHKCADCGATVNEDVYKYSTRVFKRVLCYKHQQEEKAKSGKVS